ATVGGHDPLKGFDAERGEEERAAEARDQRTGKRNDLMGRAPDHRLTDRFDHQRPECNTAAAHPARHRAEHRTDKHEADAESRHEPWLLRSLSVDRITERDIYPST